MFLTCKEQNKMYRQIECSQYKIIEMVIKNSCNSGIYSIYKLSYATLNKESVVGQVT